MNAQTKTHYIGDGSPYDVDMELIESFIYTERNPNDRMGASAVFNYYISRCQSYWVKTKNFVIESYDKIKAGGTDESLIGDELNDEWAYVILPINQLEYIKDTLDNLEQKLLLMIEEASRKFSHDYILDLDTIYDILVYIGRVSCLDLGKTINKTFPENPEFKVYFLTNYTGWFGFNTYLYAFFNKILLVGAPSQYSYFDNTGDCPLGFIEHDYNHIVDENNVTMNYSYLEYCYYNILNSQEPKYLKELLIFVLWAQIHEYGRNFYLENYNPGNYLNEIAVNIPIFTTFFQPLFEIPIPSYNELILHYDTSKYLDLITSSLTQKFLDEYTELNAFPYFICMLFGYDYMSNITHTVSRFYSP